MLLYMCVYVSFVNITILKKKTQNEIGFPCFINNNSCCCFKVDKYLMKIKGHKNVFHCYYLPFIKTRFSMSYISIYI